MIVILALIPIIVHLQMRIDPKRPQYQPGRGVGSVVAEIDNNPVVLPSQFVAGTILGFREVVAGLLWVRVNDFFHSGNYDAVVPLTRIITWLDPHQTEVYRTGAWHLSFNFVDSRARADRRLYPPALKFLEEGIENNPGVSDLEFDLGYVQYNMKGHDFPNAVYWVKRAAAREDAMLHMNRMVAHLYEKGGRIDRAIEQWESCIEHAKFLMETEADPIRGNALTHKQISERNLNLTRMRQVMRRNLHLDPLDVKFEAEFRRVGPRVFEVVGTANLPPGSRINVVLHDADFEPPDMETFTWEVDPNSTILYEFGIHGIYTDDGKFHRRYDLSKDTRQYPFRKEKYTLTLTFNPRIEMDPVQDVVGWHGEGITDKNYLDTSIPGLRQIKKVIHLDRKDII